MQKHVPSSLLSSLAQKTWERGVMTDYDRQDIPGMPLCKEYKQCMASMCYFQNLQCVIRDALLVLLGLVSSRSHACYCFFMVVYMLF